MIIDTHAHYLPQPMLNALGDKGSGFPSIEMMRDGDIFKLAFAGGAPTRPIAAKLREGELRMEWMSAQGIDAQVVGGWLDSFGYEIADEEGREWNRFLNEHLKEATDGTDRLAPLASVPLQNGAMAAEVLREALAAGFHGRTLASGWRTSGPQELAGIAPRAYNCQLTLTGKVGTRAGGSCSSSTARCDGRGPLGRIGQHQWGL